MKKFFDRAFLLGLMAFLLAVPAALLLWSRHETAAYYENRSLAAFPDITLEALWEGTLGSDLETWYSDHFPGRATLLKADTALQMDVLGRPVVNDMVVTEGVLLPKLDFSEYTEDAYRWTVTDFAEDFGALNGYIGSLGGQFLYVGFPEQRVYFEELYPAYMNNHAAEAEAADRVFAEALTAKGVDFMDMRKVYDAAGNPAEYYSIVDHHYNYYGAYAAYRAIADKLTADGWALPVLTEEDAEFVELPNPYIGSRNRKLYNLWENEDKAIVLSEVPVPYTRYDNGQLSEKPLFVYPAEAHMPTTYNLYMGGDFAETVLETNRPELPDALIFGDSFSNALETLLYTAFDETHILDLRHYKEQSLKDYLADYRPDIVICIQNDTFYYTKGGNSAVWED
jgi:hypothetical protein